MQKPNISSELLLNYLTSNGTIDLDEVCIEYEMKKYEELLSKHPYDIWQGKNEYWYTYLPDAKKGRVLKKRSTEQNLKNLVVEYYREQEENPTIAEVFREWLEKKIAYKEIQKGSADRYETDFERFFINTGFADKRIKRVEEDELEEFIRMQIAEKNLTMKAYSGLRILIRGIWKYAKKRKWTTISVSEFFGDLDISRNTFRKVIIEKEDQVFSEDEVPAIAQYIRENITIWNLGVLLVLQTGVRVGELSALKHEDWQSNILKIRRTEIRYKDENGKNTVGIKEFAKTDAGVRDIILSESGMETLRLIVKLNPNGEYLFENEQGKRIRGNTFNKRLDGILKQLGFHHRSIHKGRKTYGTTLIDSGCEDSLVMNQLGHTSIETSRKYYYFLNKTKEHQVQQIQKAITI